MANGSGLGTGGTLAASAAAVGVVVVGGLAAVGYFTPDEPEPREPTVVEQSTSAETVQEPEVSGETTEVPATEEQVAVLAAPTFDVVRVEADGNALVAGRASRALP